MRIEPSRWPVRITPFGCLAIATHRISWPGADAAALAATASISSATKTPSQTRAAASGRPLIVHAHKLGLPDPVNTSVTLERNVS